MAKYSARALARELYFNSPDLSQKEIAKRVKVSEATIGKWVEEGKWEELRTANSVTITNIRSKMARIVEMYVNNIEKKLQAGNITPGDMDGLNKAADALNKLAGHESLASYINALTNFGKWVEGEDREFAKLFTEYGDKFLQIKASELGK